MINRAPVRGGRPYAPRTLDEFEILPGVADALRRLDAAGLLLIVATNQPDVGNGSQRREVVDAMHQRLRRELPLTDIKVCYDAEPVGCECRKPKPGMLVAAAREHDVDLPASFMVGDRWRDVDAGRAAGCFTIFIDRGYDEPLNERPDTTSADLAGAAAIILNRVNS